LNDTLQKINELFQIAFDDDTLAVTRQTTAKDVEGWDSMMHVNLIVKIERELGFKFKSSEVMGFKNVGDMVDAIDSHLAAH